MAIYVTLEGKIPRTPTLCNYVDIPLKLNKKVFFLISMRIIIYETTFLAT